MRLRLRRSNPTGLRRCVVLDAVSRRGVVVSSVLAVLVAVAVGVVLKVRGDLPDDPPFAPEVPGASATLRTIGFDEAQALIPNAPHPNDDGQLLHGRVKWQPPQPGAGGVFEILVIDKRTQRKPKTIVRQGPRGGVYGNGLCCAAPYDLDKIAQRYPWLEGAADPRDGDKILSGMASLSVLPQAGGVDFVALLIPAKQDNGQPQEHWATAPAKLSDFLVALVYLGEDHQIYWAQKLYG